METISGPRILFLTRSLAVGGAQRQLVELAAGLHRSGWNVSVVTFYGGGTLEEGLQQAGIHTRCLDKGGRWDLLRFTSRLIKVIREERPHVIHAYLYGSNILLALLRPLLAGARIVWGVRASNMDLSRYDGFARMEFRASVLLSRFADLIICNSEAGRAYHVARGYRRDRMVVVPNGIDVQRFRPDKSARESLRTEWGIGPDERLIGLVGRLDPMKDHATFLRAAAHVATIRPEARYVCVGRAPDPYRRELVTLAERLGLANRLIWAGEISEVWRVYNALDLFVSSSLSEGFPNVVAEAMATGIPCVVTDVGDSAQVVGGLGWVCPPNNDLLLADAIIEALSALPLDPKPIRDRIVAQFNPEMLVKRTVEQLWPLLEHGDVTVISRYQTTKCRL